MIQSIIRSEREPAGGSGQENARPACEKSKVVCLIKEEKISFC